MRYRPFGRSGMALSTLGLYLPFDKLSKNRPLAQKLIMTALECGINTFHFDTTETKFLEMATEVFAYVERRLLFIALTLRDTGAGDENSSYSLAPLKESLRTVVKDTGLKWLDLLLLEQPVASAMPEASMDFIKTLQRSKMLRYVGAHAEAEHMAELVRGGQYDVIKTSFDIDSSWDKRRQLDNAVAHEMSVFSSDFYPDAYSRASELIPAQAKRGWFGGKPKNPLAGAGTYSFLHQTLDWTPEELCLGYVLSQPSMSCIFVEAVSTDHLEALSQVPERHLPSSVPAQIEMARFTEHAPKRANR